MGARRIVLAALLLLAGSGYALALTPDAAPAARVSHREGSVVFAPAGETQWQALRANAPVVQGDRLWTDPGARAEVHLGGAVVHLDSEAFLEVDALDAGMFQGRLHEGALHLRVRALAGGDHLEIATPDVFVRLLQRGHYRVDVDPRRGVSRVAVREGQVLVRGSKGGAITLQAGQRMEFAGPELQPARELAGRATDSFDRWAAERDRREDASLAARSARPAPVAPVAGGRWVASGSRWQWVPDAQQPPAPAAAAPEPGDVRGWRRPTMRSSRGEAEDPALQWQLDRAQRELQWAPRAAW